MRSAKQHDFVLDLGCGDGGHLPYVADRSHYIGLDIDKPSLVKLRRNHPETCVVRGNAFQLPIRSASVPCLVNIYNLEHLVYLDLALEKMARVLSPEGDCFVSVPCEGGAFWSLGRKATSARHFNSPTFDYEHAVELEHVNCIWQLDRSLTRHFRVLKRVLFPLHLPTFHLNLVATYHLVQRPVGSADAHD